MSDLSFPSVVVCLPATIPGGLNFQLKVTYHESPVDTITKAGRVGSFGYIPEALRDFVTLGVDFRLVVSYLRPRSESGQSLRQKDIVTAKPFRSLFGTLVSNSIVFTRFGFLGNR